MSLLWSQLNAPPPLVPEHKANTSLRVVLHDTKCALEQFSDRLGTLVAGVEQAKRDIDSVNACFADGHERVLEELNSAVNRSQKGLLEIMGSPAQAGVLDDVKSSQGDTHRKLTLLEDKAELVQRQLQAISEQQGHILTALAAITPLSPLLKDSPQQQAQILALLTSLRPMLESLPAQVKASQQHVLDAVVQNTACASTAPVGERHEDSRRHEPARQHSASSDTLQVSALPLRTPTAPPAAPRKRQRVSPEDMPPAPLDPVTPRRTLSTKPSLPRPRPRRPMAPTPTLRGPGIYSCTPPTLDRLPALPPRRATTLGPRRTGVPAAFFPASTPPLARRGILPRAPGAPGACVSGAEGTSDESARRPLMRRKLLSEDADEDVDIDLDWGDMELSEVT